jgi:hypothetical protein
LEIETEIFKRKRERAVRIRLIYEKRGGACFVPHVALASLFTRAARRAGVKLCSTDGFSPHAKISFGPELPAGVVALGEPVDLWVKDRGKQKMVDPKIVDPKTVDPKIGNPKTEKIGRIPNNPPANLANLNSTDLASVVVSRLNAQMPEGFRVKKCLFPAEGTATLGKECETAHYLIWERGLRSAENLLDHLKNHFGKDVLFAAIQNKDKKDKEKEEDKEEDRGKSDSRISVILAKPAQNGIGGWVKTWIPEDGRDASAAPAPGVAGWRDLCIVRTALGRWDGARMETLAGEDVAWL